MTRRNVLIEALATTPADVIRITRALDNQAATWRESRGQHSCLEVLELLLYYENAQVERLKVVNTSSNVSLLAIPNPEETMQNSTLNELTESFQLMRLETIAFLHQVSAGDWQRRATHQSQGNQTFRFYVQEMVERDIYLTNLLAEIVKQFQLSKKNRPDID